MSFNLLRSGGPFISDPRKPPRFSIESQYIIRSFSASTESAANAGFFTGVVGSMDRIPGSAAANTAYSADTYQTLLSYTGSGALSNIVSGIAQSAGATHTFRVTIDGVAYTFTARTTAADTDRAVIGWALPVSAYTGAGTSHYSFQHASASVDGFTAVLPSSAAGAIYLLGPQDPRIPFLVGFERSILVEAKMSSSPSGASNSNRAVVVVQAFS